jgi:hypothetical protein
VTLLAGAGVGAIVTVVGQWYAKDKAERRRDAITGRQVSMMVATLATMFVVVKESATEFDARRLPELMNFIRSPRFLGAVTREELTSLAPLASMEVQHLQFERVYDRLVELHRKALLGPLSPVETGELDTMEMALGSYAKRSWQTLDGEVRPAITRITQRLEARAHSLLYDPEG